MRIVLAIIAGLLSVNCWGTVSESTTPSPFKIEANEPFKSPISPLLYGNFIELGYGYQVEPMCSEMFFNRSFEVFPPYKTINKLWYDLYYDEKDLDKGYEKDWSKFDWYHSGYEHNGWYAAPGTPEKGNIIADESTFFITTTPQRKIVITPQKGGAGHGKQCLLVTNNEAEEWGALAQDGKLFRKGKKYHFTGKMKSEKAPLNAEVRFYTQGKWEKPIAVIPLENITGNFEEKSFLFENKDYEGYVTFSLWIPPHSSVTVDDFSLKPTDDYYGWRPEAVEVFKQMAPKVVRFPGGCFASFYDWREGVGPLSERTPVDSYFWGGQNSNDVGTAEFAMLCKAAGTEMQMCVNVYHPSKRQYDLDFPDGQSKMGTTFEKFMSLTEGAKAAADWVAYCNLSAGTHPMADLRVKHGYKEPFRAKFWELDNEVLRWFEAEDYAWAAVVYSRAMKAVDPTIQIGLSSYGARPGGSDYHRDLEKMLAIAGHDIDFLADRADADGMTRMMIDKVRKYNAENGTHIKYSDTEWLAYNTEHKRDAYNLAERGEVTKSYAFSKWMYGLNLLKNFMGFQRMGDEMLFVNFNNLANTHSQCAMDTPKEGAYLTASGRALELLSHSPAAWLLSIENYKPNMEDEYQVQAAWDKERQKLVLYVCNRTADMRHTEFDLTALKRNFKNFTWKRLIADTPVAMNTLQNPNAIEVQKKKGKTAVTNGIYSVKTPAWSFTEIVLE